MVTGKVVPAGEFVRANPSMEFILSKANVLRMTKKKIIAMVPKKQVRRTPCGAEVKFFFMEINVGGTKQIGIVFFYENKQKKVTGKGKLFFNRLSRLLKSSLQYFSSLPVIGIEKNHLHDNGHYS